MIKYACDRCGKDAPRTPPILRPDSEGDGNVYQVLLIGSTSGFSMTRHFPAGRDVPVSYEGHFCVHCLIDLVNSCDDRPRVPGGGVKRKRK